MMNLMTILGIFAIVLGVAILIWPVILSVAVGLALIVGGAVAIYRGTSRAGVT